MSIITGHAHREILTLTVSQKDSNGKGTTFMVWFKLPIYKPDAIERLRVNLVNLSDEVDKALVVNEDYDNEALRVDLMRSVIVDNHQFIWSTVEYICEEDEGLGYIRFEQRVDLPTTVESDVRFVESIFCLDVTHENKAQIAADFRAVANLLDKRNGFRAGMSPGGSSPPPRYSAPASASAASLFSGSGSSFPLAGGASSPQRSSSSSAGIFSNAVPQMSQSPARGMFASSPPASQSFPFVGGPSSASASSRAMFQSPPTQARVNRALFPGSN